MKHTNNRIMKTKRNTDGNYEGVYKGIKFIIYAITKEWNFMINHDCPYMGNNQMWFSTNELAPTRTKKECILQIQCVIEQGQYKA